MSLSYNTALKEKRRVSLPLTLKLLFGGGTNQTGWCIFAFGLILTMLFKVPDALKSFSLLGAKTELATGTIIDVYRTNVEVNDRDVFGVLYQFETPNGDSYEKASYSNQYVHESTKEVIVKYIAKNPEISQAVGYDYSPGGYIIFLVLVFPGVGLMILFTGFRKGIRANDLLGTGVYTTGRLVSQGRTGVEINDQPVFKLQFEFSDTTGCTHILTEKTHNIEKLTDDVQEGLLYDRRKPSYAVLLDNLPAKFKVNDAGNLEVLDGSEIVSALLSLIVPAIVIIYLFIQF